MFTRVFSLCKAFSQSKPSRAFLVNWDQVLKGRKPEVINLISLILQNKLKFEIQNMVEYRLEKRYDLYDYLLLGAAIKTVQNPSLSTFITKNIFSIFSTYQNDLILPEAIILRLVSLLEQSITKSNDKVHVKKFKIHMISFLQIHAGSVKSFEGLRELIKILVTVFYHPASLEFVRLQSISHMIQLACYNYIKSNRQPAISKKSFYFFLQFLKFTSILGFVNKEVQKFAVNFVTEKTFFPNNIHPSDQLRSYLTYFRYTNNLTYTPDFCTQHPILLKIEERAKTDPLFMQSIQKYQKSYLNLTFLFMMQSLFHEVYLKTPSTEIEDCIVITSLLDKPKLGWLQKLLLKISWSSLTNSEFLVELIKTLYQEEIQSNGQIVNKNYSNLYQLSTDNQPILRLTRTLTCLGLQFVREQRVMGNKVDFLLSKQKIVIEFDGEWHLDYIRKDVTLKTGMRNASLMYGGYRVIVIDIIDFNQNRSSELLQKLISKKLDLMKKHSALLVH